MNRFISLGEVRLGLRLIVKQPILSLTIILALATGICFATMGFTFRDELVNSTLPYQAGDRFARVYVFESRGGRLDLDLERYHIFRDRRDVLRAHRRGRRPAVHGDARAGRSRIDSRRPDHAALDAVARCRADRRPHADSRRWRTGRRARRRDSREFVAAPLLAATRHLIGRRDHGRRPAAHGRRHHARHVRVS